MSSTTKSKTRQKRLCWFVGLYLSGMIALTIFHLLSNQLIAWLK